MRFLALILVALLLSACNSETTKAEENPERTTDSLLVYADNDSTVTLKYSEVDGLRATLDYRFEIDPVMTEQGIEAMYYLPKAIYAHYISDTIPSVRCTLSVIDSTSTLCSYGVTDSIWSILLGCDEIGIIQGGIRYKGQELKNTNW